MSNILVMNTPKGKIETEVSLDGEKYRRILRLLRNAEQYKRPPQELVELIRLQQQEFVDPMVRSLVQIMNDLDLSFSSATIDFTELF